MRHILLPLLAAGLWLAPTHANAHGGGEMARGAAIAVIDFDYVDTSGEERDQRKVHEAQLGTFMNTLRRDLGQGAGYRLVTPTCQPGPCSLADTPIPDLLAAARQAGANILLIGGVHKMSTLVQWAKIEALDVGTGSALFDKLFTFRGDTDDAWRRAETFVFKEITAPSATDVQQSASVPAPNPPPVKIAVFDFELDDLSGGAGIAGAPAADLSHLDQATTQARQLLAASGRYSLIDVAGADSDAVKTRSLRQCDGCEAAIALKLGADQSLVGVVTRISRTEYMVRLQIRDAHTGAVVLAPQSDLRMGADYSWNRGAARLIKDHIISTP